MTLKAIQRSTKVLWHLCSQAKRAGLSPSFQRGGPWRLLLLRASEWYTASQDQGDTVASGAPEMRLIAGVSRGQCIGAKEDYSQTLNIMGFALLFLDLLGTSETFLLSNLPLMNVTTYPVPVLPLYFGSKLFVWLHRFTTREKLASRWIIIWAYPHWYRYLAEIWDLELIVGWVKIWVIGRRINVFYIWQGCEFWRWRAMDCIVFSHKFIHWISNHQYLRMWQYLDTGFLKKWLI